jgi:hypothetical protein
MDDKIKLSAKGYGIEATLTPHELRARGTNKATHLALVGPESPHEEDGHLVLPLDQIASVQHTRPKMAGFVNGHVVVRTVDGRKYEMHYRAKKQAGFADLGDALAAAVNQG